MLTAILLAVALVCATVLIHYECLRATSALIPHLHMRPRSRMIVVLGAALLGHTIEISLYAWVYHVMDDFLELGSIAGEFTGGALDYFYFSATTFTTLGIGDVYAKGYMRLVAGMESLNGLVLIGWSASFTYLSMEKFWEDHRVAQPRRPSFDDRAGSE